MGPLVSGAVVLFWTPLLALIFGVSSAMGQDLQETDALCTEDGCFVVYFQRRTFLESWRACKEKGGNLATIKRKVDAANIASLFSTVDLRYSRTKVQVWIGLQRQPRQCTASRPLRGFSWTTGDHDTDYTNWQKEYSSNMCSVPRCVVMGYSTEVQEENFKWLDGACSVAVDGYLCHYAYRGMCSALWSEGAGNALYTTPFNLLSTLLTHIPIGSSATLPCPAGTSEEQSVVCQLKEDNSVGWSRAFPLCPDAPALHNWCDHNKGGCEHFCRSSGDRFSCECAEGYVLGDDGQTCELSDACQGFPCEYECLRLPDGYRCACPDGYMLGPDEHGCVDVDECLQSPCEHRCVNSPGTFECHCDQGYIPDEDGGCEDIDECATDPCEHDCENTEGSYICHCHLGFSLQPEDQNRCQDTDECQIAGTCEQMCVNYEGGFECYCEEGYALLSDHFSCQKIGDHPAVTAIWDPEEVEWDPQQGHTDWPLGVDHGLEWLTDPPKVLNSDVIWVTSVPREEPLHDPVIIPMYKGTEKYADEQEQWFWEPDPQLEPTTSLTTSTLSSPSTTAPGLSTTTSGPGTTSSDPSATSSGPSTTTPGPSTTSSGPSTTSSGPSTIAPGPSTTEYYYEEEEETTTALPVPSTSTISEGAWNWWDRLTTTVSEAAGNPDDTFIDLDLSTDSSVTGEDKPGLGKSSPVKTVEKVDIEITQNPAVPTHRTAYQRPTNAKDSVEEDKTEKQSNTWLLVGLLVPLCIFIVVIVVLAILYCTRYSVESRNKKPNDCYHWISGAHDKQGAAHPSAGAKSHV
ncbi:CD248 molecule, endosialin a [Synchiropus picturatus]